MRSIVAGILLAISATPVFADQFIVVGIGRSSCATWASNSDYQNWGDMWVLGFWSGSNSTNPVNQKVGESTDALGVIASVKKVCLEDPAEKLATAATIAYARFGREGR